MLGGAALALAYYVIIRHSAMRRVAMRFVLLSVVALTASSLVIWLLGKLGVHIIPNAAGPYSLITTIKEPILGSIFAGLGVLTNFGANPMYDAAVFRAMPGLLRSRLLTYGGLGFVVNGIILLVATRAAYVTTFKKANKEKKQHDLASDTPLVVSRLLVFTSLAAIGAFIVTKHYYVVDARYLQIILFTLFICLATYARPFTLNAKNAMGIRILCMIAIIFGLVFTATTYRSSQRALQRTEQRNQLVAEALTHYRVKLLVGDYWRVFEPR